MPSNILSYHHILRDLFGLDPERHGDLVQAMQPVELRGGEWLFKQGDPADSLYFLVRGRLQAWLQDGDDRGRLLNEIAAGEAVGEVGLLTDAPRSAGVRARRDSLLFRIDRSALDELARSHPEMVMQISASVAHRLARNTQRRHTRPAPRTLALVTLEHEPELMTWIERLASDLCKDGQGQVISPANLETLAPPGTVNAGIDNNGSPGPALKQWLAEQEEQFERLVFLVSPEQAGWNDYALRQADQVVYLAPASADSSLRSIESMAIDSESAPDACNSLLVLRHGAGTTTISGTARWLESRPGARPLHVRADIAADHERLVRLLTGRAVGLVLSGGAVRGLAHLGVIKAMEELGIPVDWVGGTSMGAVMAACSAMGWDSDEAIAQARIAFVEGRPLSDYTLPLLSLMRGKRMERLIQRFFPSRIEDLPIPFFAISANLNTGDTNVHESGPVWRALCASASLPGLFPPAVHERELTIDGAVVNNLPVDVMQQRLVGEVIAVNLGAHRQRKVDFDEAPSPWAVLGGLIWPFGRRKKVPSVASMMLKAIELGTRKRVQELSERADLLICPPIQRFNMIDVNQYDDLVQTGYESGLETLQTWLGEKEDQAGDHQPK